MPWTQSRELAHLGRSIHSGHGKADHRATAVIRPRLSLLRDSTLLRALRLRLEQGSCRPKRGRCYAIVQKRAETAEVRVYVQDIRSEPDPIQPNHPSSAWQQVCIRPGRI